MNKPSDWTVPWWPFISAWILLLATAAVLVFCAAHPISQTIAILATTAVALGTLLGCLPFILEYRATAKLIEVNALGTVTDKFAGLEAFAAQVAAATDQWARVQEATQGGAEKTVTAAKEIADRMTAEVREFNEFQTRMNTTEKNALRLEVEKMHRAEGEWLQVVARILDHVFALNNAAARSGQPELAAQIGNFQHACRDAARRVGFVQFEAVAGETFDGEKHRVQGEENPAADSIVAETLAPGLSFQGRLIRPVLVRLQEKAAPEPAKTASDAESDQLTLEQD